MKDVPELPFPENVNEVSVQDEFGQYHRVETPTGFTTLSFRRALAGIYTFYIDRGTLPTVDELYKLDPSYPKKTYAGLYLTPELKQALLYRGINWDSTTGLSLEQHAVLTKLSDPTDRRNLATKLRELSVPMPRYQAWMKQPLFADHYNRVTASAYTEYLPAMRTALISNALNNDQKAIEMVFAITGEWNPNQQTVQDAKLVVMQVIEAVIKHVGDPETRRAIMEDVQAAVLTYNVTNLKSLE